MNIVNRSANMLVFAKSRGVLIRAYKYLIYTCVLFIYIYIHLKKLS